jgi:FMN phosphatase YigB (HAD superfamily)
MKLGPVAAVVFDLDGTLYPQHALRRAMALRLIAHVVRRPGDAATTLRALRAYRQAQERLRESQCNSEADTETEANSTRTLHAVDPVGGQRLSDAQMRLASERSGLALHVIAPIVARWMEREPLQFLERLVDPSLRELLSSAKTRGLRLAVLSDYPAAAKLDAMKLSGFFDVVVSAQDPAVNRFKPHPAGLLETLRRLDVPPSQALYVGDRLDVDAVAAAAAGVRFVLLETRRMRATWPTPTLEARPGRPPLRGGEVPVPSVQGYAPLREMLSL